MKKYPKIHEKNLQKTHKKIVKVKWKKSLKISSRKDRKTVSFVIVRTESLKFSFCFRTTFEVIRATPPPEAATPKTSPLFSFREKIFKCELFIYFSISLSFQAPTRRSVFHFASISHWYLLHLTIAPISRRQLKYYEYLMVTGKDFFLRTTRILLLNYKATRDEHEENFFTRIDKILNARNKRNFTQKNPRKKTEKLHFCNETITYALDVFFERMLD